MERRSGRPDRLHRAGLTLRERLHRELQRPTTRRAPERGGLLHPQGSPGSHRILATPLQRLAPAQQPGIPAAGTRDDRHAKLGARLRYAPPATQLGRGTCNALTFDLHRSLGAGHGRARWIQVALQPLRGGDDLVRIVPEPSLPQVPDAGPDPVGRAPVCRSPRHRLLACRVHPAARTQSARAAPSRTHLPPAVQGSFADADRVRTQSPMARRRARRHHGAAYLGAESGIAHPHPLHRHRWRPESRREALVGAASPGIPFQHPGSLEGLSRQVSRASLKNARKMAQWNFPASGSRNEPTHLCRSRI